MKVEPTAIKPFRINCMIKGIKNIDVGLKKQVAIRLQ